MTMIIIIMLQQLIKIKVDFQVNILIYDNDNNYYAAAVDKDKSRFPGGHLDL